MKILFSFCIEHFGAKSSKILALIVSLFIFTGCTVVMLASGQKGKDVTGVKLGSSRVEAEAVLGNPVREWRSTTGVFYCTYKYDCGCEPEPGLALAWLILDVATVFVLEAVIWSSLDLNKSACDYNRILIAYNSNSQIIGIFEEFEALPRDGCSTKYTSVDEFERKILKR